MQAHIQTTQHRLTPPKGNRTEGTRRRDGLIKTTHPLPACLHILSRIKAERKTQSVTVLNSGDGEEHLSDTQMPVRVLDETGATQRETFSKNPRNQEACPHLPAPESTLHEAISRAHEISPTSLRGCGPGPAALCSDAGLGIWNMQHLKSHLAGEGSCLVTEHIFSGDLEDALGLTQVGREHDTHRKAGEQMCHSLGV